MLAIGIGSLEILIIMIVGCLLPGLTLWGIISAATFDSATWQRTGDSKTLWIVLQICLGALGAAVYLIAIRPKLKAADGAGPPHPGPQ